jgi:hypothetical protein
MRWQREHELINGNLYCKVSIWDSEINQWISKSDVGCESNTEATKGEASDSFKRACFNWGIGRELYTAPFTYVAISENERYDSQGKFKAHPSLKFSVKSIDYTEQDGKRTISKLEIVDNKGVVRYSLGATQPKPTAQPQPKPQAPAENPDLIVALQEVKEAQTVADLSDVKKRWRDSLGTNNEFVDALTKKYNSIINK